MQNRIKRVYFYARVSAAAHDDVSASLDRQHEGLAQLAARLHVRIVREFVDVESGAAEREERRAGLARLLEVVGPGDVVAVSAWDRLARERDCASRIVRKVQSKGARFISIAGGEHPPVGYRRAKGRGKVPQFSLDPTAAPMVMETFDRYLRNRVSHPMARRRRTGKE